MKPREWWIKIALKLKQLSIRLYCSTLWLRLCQIMNNVWSYTCFFFQPKLFCTKSVITASRKYHLSFCPQKQNMHLCIEVRLINIFLAFKNLSVIEQKSLMSIFHITCVCVCVLQLCSHWGHVGVWELYSQHEGVHWLHSHATGGEWSRIEPEDLGDAGNWRAGRWLCHFSNWPLLGNQWVFIQCQSNTWPDCRQVRRKQRP